jgi:MarR family transcriptional regulator, 2-MHQ and catechol-resistance regulon repressor
MQRNEGIRACVEYARDVTGVDPKSLERCMTFMCLITEIDRQVNRHLERHGLSKTRFSTLKALYHHPDRCLTPAELADRVGITRAAMTTVLDGLESRELVVRERRPGDRRLVYVCLTADGAAFLDDILPDHYRGLCSIMEPLTATEQETLTRLYEKIAVGVRDLFTEVDSSVSPYHGAPLQRGARSPGSRSSFTPARPSSSGRGIGVSRRFAWIIFRSRRSPAEGAAFPSAKRGICGAETRLQAAGMRSAKNSAKEAWGSSSPPTRHRLTARWP